MRNALKFLLALSVAILLMLAIRAYAFTIFTVTDSALSPALQKGDRVLVNRLNHAPVEANDLIVFGDTMMMAGIVEAIPGDTISLHGARYLLTQGCRARCRCTCCRLYYVKVGQGHRLVQHADIVGKAFRIFPIRK